MLIRVTIEVRPDGSVIAKGVDECLRVEADNVTELFDKLIETLAIRNSHPVITLVRQARVIASA